MDKEFDRLVNRMNRAYGIFLQWKIIKKSISTAEFGKDEAERRTEIMNRYGGLFSGILYSLENSFITDLHKFFDKKSNNLSLKTILNKVPTGDQKDIQSLIKSIQIEVKRIETSRHNFTAHEPTAQKQEKIFTLEIENTFSVVQKILNIISKSVRKDFMIWDLVENNTNQSFAILLDDLDLGYKTRLASESDQE